MTETKNPGLSTRVFAINPKCLWASSSLQGVQWALKQIWRSGRNSRSRHNYLKLLNFFYSSRFDGQYYVLLLSRWQHKIQRAQDEYCGLPLSCPALLTSFTGRPPPATRVNANPFCDRAISTVAKNFCFHRFLAQHPLQFTACLSAPHPYRQPDQGSGDYWAKRCGPDRDGVWCRRSSSLSDLNS